MGGRKNISKLIKKIVSDKNGVRRTVYVKPPKMQVHKSRNNPNWEQTKKEFAKMGVTLYGEKVLEDSYALKRLENTLKDFNAVNFFKTHKDILDNVKFQTSQDVEYNFNVSRVGEGLVQTNMENEDMIIIRNIEPKYKSATHESFHLDEYLQGKGIGKEIMKVEFEEYQKSGITKVELQANSDVDAVLSVGPHVCEAVAKAIDDLGMTVHHSCFDLSPGVMDLIGAGKVSFTIDQQQRLQGYMPIIVLHLYNNGAGLLPGANIPSGPGFVDKSNASSVAALAGIDR